jgi:hypothetical protein
MKTVIIVGAGPAGLFAANELAEKRKVIVIDKGRSVGKRLCPLSSLNACKKCQPCNILCGVGGSGTFSDGLLNLCPDIVGGDLTEFTDRDDANRLVNFVDETFLKYGAPNKLQDNTDERIEELKRNSRSYGVRFINLKQRHIGSDNSPKVIGNFENDLVRRGVEFMLEKEVCDFIVEGGICKGVALKSGEKLNSDEAIFCPGRNGTNGINELIEKHNIGFRYGPIDVGVRVEIPAIVMKHVTDLNRDPKFHIFTKTYDDFVRTYCVNERGFVVKENHDGFVTTNGHSMVDTKSRNTNFAFLVRIQLTEPLENTRRYGKSIAKLATTIGGGKPIVQRFGDLRRGHRTTAEKLKRNPMEYTLNEATPGDISMALPHRIITDIKEGLEQLNKIIPGVASDCTLLYAPEIKFYSLRFDVGPDMQTSLKGLFAAGDGCGLSRDIVNASATGILAARGILQNN